MLLAWTLLQCTLVVHAIWPEPALLLTGNATLVLADSVIFRKQLLYADSEHSHDALSCQHAHNIRLDTMIDATKTLLKDGFKPWMLTSSDKFEPETLKNKLVIHEITLVQRLREPVHDHVASEHYHLEVTEEAKVTIAANSSIGLWRGMTTLTQLFYTHSKEDLSYTTRAPIIIEDAPAFEWRGLNLDVARNFIPVARIKRIIDAMSWNKMNRLHLHVTDSQSWPLHIPSLPQLSEQGAFAGHMVYSAEDFKELQAYAKLRAVDLVTEIDMPGHTASIHAAFPDLITGYNVQAKPFPESSTGYSEIATKDWSPYCAEPPCGQLKLNSTNVDEFLETLLTDVLPRVQEYTSYFHAGGDEVNKNVYLLQEHLQTNDSTILKPLVSKLALSVHNQIRKHGLIPVAWEEMLLDWDIDLPRDTLIQSWISPASIARIIDRGYSVIAGSSASTYLDCGKGQWLDFTPAAVPYQASQGFVDYCSPFKNWKTIYAYDPLFNLTATQRPFVKGFEVHAWSEQIDAYNIETALWPRAAAAAEVGWSGSATSGARIASQSDRPNAHRSMEGVGARLSEWRERMVHRGIQVEPIHSMWCTQRPGQCSL